MGRTSYSADPDTIPPTEEKGWEFDTDGSLWHAHLDGLWGKVLFRTKIIIPGTWKAKYSDKVVERTLMCSKCNMLPPTKYIQWHRLANLHNKAEK